MSKARDIIKMYEQIDTINDYFDQWKSYFSPSDWEKITSLLKRLVGIPFAQLRGKEADGSLSPGVINTLVRPEDPGATIGPETYFFYYSGTYKDMPFMLGGFGDPTQEAPKYLYVRKVDQAKWREEFKGELK